MSTQCSSALHNEDAIRLDESNLGEFVRGLPAKVTDGSFGRLDACAWVFENHHA